MIGYHARPKSDEYDYDVKSLEEMTEMGKTYETQSTSLMHSISSKPRETRSQLHTEPRIDPISKNMDDHGFNQSSSNMGSHISRGGSHMSSQVGTSSHMNGDVPSYYDEVVEEEEEDTMRPLPQFQRSRIPNASRQMQWIRHFNGVDMLCNYEEKNISYIPARSDNNCLVMYT